METKPYGKFWVEVETPSKHAWRPTDESRRKLQQIWVLQGLLLVACIALAVMLAKESKRMPPVYAKLPNGIVFEATATPLQMDRLARMEMVNNTLQLLYYQEGSFNYLATLKNNVKPDILTKFRGEMAMAASMTNMTVYANVMETFQTGFTEGKGFNAMSKVELIKRSPQENTSGIYYIQTTWLDINGNFILTAINDGVKSPDYIAAFQKEKARIAGLKPEELKRELDARMNKDIPISPRRSLF